MQHLAILSSSLNENSRSRQLARLMHAHAIAKGTSTSFTDLRDLPLPLAGGASDWDHSSVGQLRDALVPASHILIAVPIYNFYANAAVKNAIELAGDVFGDKVVGFLCAAGGAHSYMSVMSLANSLMLDFRTVIVPRFLYVTSGDWADSQTLKPEIQQRLELLYEDTRRIQLVQ